MVAINYFFSNNMKPLIINNIKPLIVNNEKSIITKVIRSTISSSIREKYIIDILYNKDNKNKNKKSMDYSILKDIIS